MDKKEQLRKVLEGMSVSEITEVLEEKKNELKNKRADEIKNTITKLETEMKNIRDKIDIKHNELSKLHKELNEKMELKYKLSNELRSLVHEDKKCNGFSFKDNDGDVWCVEFSFPNSIPFD